MPNRRHNSNEDRSARPRPYICDICQHSCTRPVELEVHRRTHTHETPFKCVPCNKSFTTRSNLTRHIKGPKHCFRVRASEAVSTSRGDGEDDDYGEDEDGDEGEDDSGASRAPTPLGLPTVGDSLAIRGSSTPIHPSPLSLTSTLPSVSPSSMSTRPSSSGPTLLQPDPQSGTAHHSPAYISPDLNMGTSALRRGPYHSASRSPDLPSERISTTPPVAVTGGLSRTHSYAQSLASLPVARDTSISPFDVRTISPHDLPHSNDSHTQESIMPHPLATRRNAIIDLPFDRQSFQASQPAPPNYQPHPLAEYRAGQSPSHMPPAPSLSYIPPAAATGHDMNSADPLISNSIYDSARPMEDIHMSQVQALYTHPSDRAHSVHGPDNASWSMDSSHSILLDSAYHNSHYYRAD